MKDCLHRHSDLSIKHFVQKISFIDIIGKRKIAEVFGSAFGAGLVDAVAGGGGLIQVPALFSALPHELPATIFGTNKGSSVFGTAHAAWRYARRIELPWRVALPAAEAEKGRRTEFVILP